MHLHFISILLNQYRLSSHNYQMDMRPNVSPKPVPRALQSSLCRPNIDSPKELGNMSKEKISFSNHIEMLETNGDETNGSSGQKDDEVDDGLAALKRQPSIKDRKKVT